MSSFLIPNETLKKKRKKEIFKNFIKWKKGKRHVKLTE